MVVRYSGRCPILLVLSILRPGFSKSHTNHESNIHLQQIFHSAASHANAVILPNKTLH